MKKPQSTLLILVSCLMVCAGCIVSMLHGIIHAPEYIAAYLTKVDHPIRPKYDSYNRFLQEVVKGDRVDYARAKSSDNLDKALKEFASLGCDEFVDDGERLAYWINAYNLLVVKTVSDRFPVASIESVSNDLGSHRYTIGGQPITAKDILQLKITPLMKGTRSGDWTDARMLFLICGGAIGYPVLSDHALTEDRVAKDMDVNVYKFLQHPHNLYCDRMTSTLYISPFFQWNTPILQQSFADPFDFVLTYMDPKDKPDSTSIHFKETYSTKFDWRINDTATKD